MNEKFNKAVELDAYFGSRLVPSRKVSDPRQPQLYMEKPLKERIVLHVPIKRRVVFIHL